VKQIYLVITVNKSCRKISIVSILDRSVKIVETKLSSSKITSNEL